MAGTSWRSTCLAMKAGDAPESVEVAASFIIT
jgi:hypothetical protein